MISTLTAARSCPGNTIHFNFGESVLRHFREKIPSKRHLLAATLSLGCLLFAGCANIPASQSGFLNRYDALQPIENHPGVSGYRSQLAGYRRVYIEPVAWKVSATENDALCDEDRAELEQALDSAIRAQIAPLAAVSRPGNDVLRVRAAITSVKPSSPALNIALTALLIGPLNNGGAAVEIEAIDGASGLQVAALNGAETGSFISVGGFSRIGHAREAVEKLGGLFAERLH